MIIITPMFKVYIKRHWHIHFFNRLSIYWEPYLTLVTTEYWQGYRRKRILKLGKLTAWMRGGDE